MCFRKITLLLIDWFEGSVSGLEEMGQSYFNNTSKKENGETQVCDCGEEKEGAESKT